MLVTFHKFVQCSFMRKRKMNYFLLGRRKKNILPGGHDRIIVPELATVALFNQNTIFFFRSEMFSYYHVNHEKNLHKWTRNWLDTLLEKKLRFGLICLHTIYKNWTHRKALMRIGVEIYEVDVDGTLTSLELNHCRGDDLGIHLLSSPDSIFTKREVVWWPFWDSSPLIHF